uniref:B30.2/SPRY domain-containing protein n=1 Tax=Corethron hystrix TaxID=216773 RepID=A0A7S1BYK4_9STRA|mmetsp:Transcript_6984/g.15107  ORF Transcript_6984/g.15107 Transcript_6984/m.15107 type:complete len:970 (+) Transcript_6984:120-3029(+)
MKVFTKKESPDDIPDNTFSSKKTHSTGLRGPRSVSNGRGNASNAYPRKTPSHGASNTLETPVALFRTGSKGLKKSTSVKKKQFSARERPSMPAKPTKASTLPVKSSRKTKNVDTPGGNLGVSRKGNNGRKIEPRTPSEKSVKIYRTSSRSSTGSGRRLGRKKNDRGYDSEFGSKANGKMDSRNASSSIRTPKAKSKNVSTPILKRKPANEIKPKTEKAVTESSEPAKFKGESTEWPRNESLGNTEEEGNDERDSDFEDDEIHESFVNDFFTATDGNGNASDNDRQEHAQHEGFSSENARTRKKKSNHETPRANKFESDGSDSYDEKPSFATDDPSVDSAEVSVVAPLENIMGKSDRVKNLPIQVESKTIDYLNSINHGDVSECRVGPQVTPRLRSGTDDRDGSTFALDERVRSVSYESIYSQSFGYNDDVNDDVDESRKRDSKHHLSQSESERTNSIGSETDTDQDEDSYADDIDQSDEFGSSNDIANSRIGIMAVSRKKGKSFGSKEKHGSRSIHLSQEPLSRLKSPIDGLDDFSKLHVMSYLPAHDLRRFASTNMIFMRLSRSLGLWIEHCERRWAVLKYVIRRHPESQIAFKDMLLIPSAPYSLEQRAYLSMYKYHMVRNLVIMPENHHQHQSMVSPNMSLLHKMSTVYPSSMDKRFFVPVRTRSGKKIIPEFRSFKTRALTRAFASSNVQVMQFCAPIKGSLHVCQSNRPFPRSPEPAAPLMWGLLNPMESLLGEPPMAKPFCAPIVTMLEEDKTADGPIKVELDVTPTLLAYFEVSIVPRDKAQEPKELSGQTVPALKTVPQSMTVGIARDVDKYDHNKWLRGAFGYDGNNGTIFHMRSRTKRESAEAPRFGVGDTVGCGIDYASRSMFFTLNGYFLQAFLGLDLYEDYFATVDTISDSPFYVNFGMHPFLFDISPFRKRHNPLIERSLPNSNGDSPSDAISKEIVRGIQKYVAALGPTMDRQP